MVHSHGLVDGQTHNHSEDHDHTMTTCDPQDGTCSAPEVAPANDSGKPHSGW